jgi:hypothetical protein
MHCAPCVLPCVPCGAFFHHKEHKEERKAHNEDKIISQGFFDKVG